MKIPLIFLCFFAAFAQAAEPILDWTDWQKNRDHVKHPALAIKSADLDRARENIKRHPWAQKYFETLRSSATAASEEITPQFLERMIPATTPGSENYTPCPACRDQHKPVHPHGQWSWNPKSPDEMKCEVCGTVFPNEKYPESIVLHAKWGKSQDITYCGGEPFVLFNYLTGRPSFSGYIRTRKVWYVAQLARQVAEAHALTGDARFAKSVRAILLRFAEVYPNWLVHVGYGEYADMDPHVAAAAMEKLPEDELVYPPNKPDRELFTRFWNVGRATGSGIEGRFVRSIVEAYDLTFDAQDDAGKPIYSEVDRRTIEHDLLLESTVLLTAEDKIDNKSMANRTAAALVGACLGHERLVNFGLDGFDKTIGEWFLPDGSTPESFSYAMMALGGVVDLSESQREYRDPKYAQVWSALFNSQQGDLTFPPIADTYPGRGIGASMLELMAANYPDRPQYAALLREVCGKDSQNIDARTAIYRRDPDFEKRDLPRVRFEDVCLPDLRMGFMRSGDDGRESLLLLNASRWGNHHHLDSLGLYYWKNGQELLSDLGYLWDHPDKHMSARTFAHNTVLIDEQDQQTEARGGDVQFFRVGENFKVMRTSSTAYANAKIYSRTSALIDHLDGASYAVDFFNVQGGTMQDYVFHGPNLAVELEKLPVTPTSETIYDLQKLRAADGEVTWNATWKLGDAMSFAAWSIGQCGERVFIGNGWGQRDYRNSDLGAQLPYVVRRCRGPEAKEFVSIFEGYHTDHAQVVSVRKLDAPAQVSALMIETRSGRDYIISAPNAKPIDIKTVDGTMKCASEFVIKSVGPSSTGRPDALRKSE